MSLSIKILCLNHAILLLFLQANCQSFVLFNFTSFSAEILSKNIAFEGDASAGNATLELTKVDRATGFPVQHSAGRASYSKPVRLWDQTTGVSADFTTHFSFRIKANDTERDYGDGISFFIAPFESEIPANSSGGYLALFSPDSAINSTRTGPIVAVEFDSNKNPWDPSSDHVGINVNSIVSVTNISWNSSIKDGRVANAWVSYVSASNILNVFLTYAENPEYSGQSVLGHRIDWKTVLPERVRVGFSGGTGDSFETHNILSWSFTTSLDESRSNRKSGLGLGLGLGFGLLACLSGAGLFVIWRRRASRRRAMEEEEEEYDESIDGEFGETGPKRFTYHELSLATNGFPEEGKLGQGGFGEVYRGVLPDSGAEIAVKRISKGSSQGKKEYISEVKIISRLRHRNLVQLIGWCHSQGSFLLVYEYLPNGSLDKHLFGPSRGLTWTARQRIAHGLASALLYLHEEWEQCVVHRDIKSSNVMLDQGFNAKLGDFGLARFADHDSGLQTTMLAGTMGYMAPECVTTGKASKESDVYSFGVVALEICSGRRPVDRNAEPGRVSLVEWAWDLYGRGRILEACDARLAMEFDEQQMEALMVVGLWCCHPDPSFRPSIKQVVSVLNLEAPLPNLPAKLPRPMYFAPSMNMDSSFYTSSTRDQSRSSENYFTDPSKSEAISRPLNSFSQDYV